MYTESETETQSDCGADYLPRGSKHITSSVRRSSRVSENGDGKVKRKRNRPKFFDPSPPPARKRRSDLSLASSAKQAEKSPISNCYPAMNPSLVPTFNAIINKHGDILKDCMLKSAYLRTSVLEVICKIIQELGNTKLHELDDSCLSDYYSIVEDAKNVKLNVNWLEKHLDSLNEAVVARKEASYISRNFKERDQHIQTLKRELQILKSKEKGSNAEIDTMERQLVFETMDADKTNRQIRSLTTKFLHFQINSLADGLLSV